jgi:hypothetical protein
MCALCGVEMNWQVRTAWAVAILFLANAALAEAPAVEVWYRSSAGCPDGAQFVARLGALGRKARLASAGDHVDFVVTLGPAAGEGEQPQNLGRLERQTDRGTVAVREVRAANCADVAEALALSLELAMVPASEMDNKDKPGESASPPTSSQASPSGSGSSSTDVAATPESGGASNRRGVQLGLQATLATGIAPAVLPGLSLFAGVGGAGGPEARLAARASYGASSAAATDLRVTLVTGRLEGCPVSWAPGSISIAPCASLDFGLLRAESPGASGRADSGVWSSGGAAVRASFRAAAKLSLEAEIGMVVPFVRYDLGPDDGVSTFFRTAAMGVAGGFGAGWNLP